MATNRKTRPDKTPRGMLTKLLAVVASLASADVVRNAAEFRAELARGAPSIELADNLYLEGEAARSQT